MNTLENTGHSRRDFLKASSAAALAGAVLTPSLLHAQNPPAAKSPGETLRVGLIGCGGRGTGAAAQALNADSNIELFAMGDVFEGQLNSSLQNVTRSAGEEKVKVKPENKFLGLDAYRKVIDAGVDVVILATPPGFRPVHLRAAIEANKHVFCEKPMATDAPGVRSVMESARMAKEKSLALVAGFCWRYDLPLRALFKRIHGGEIGDVHAIYGTYLTGPVRPMPPADSRPKGISDLEWMIRNWYNFNWLGGDGLVEQAVHTADWLGWVMKDVPPVSCTAVGGRQIPAHGGNIYDHIEVNYLWENGTRGFIAQRQIPGCHNENNLTVIGSKGVARFDGRGARIEGANEWKYDGEKPSMYQVEHNELFASIRSGKRINDGDRMASSTLMAIMGRNAAYTGQELSWEQILNSQQVLVPEIEDWNSKVLPEPMAMPGITRFV